MIEDRDFIENKQFPLTFRTFLRWFWCVLQGAAFSQCRHFASSYFFHRRVKQEYRLSVHNTLQGNIYNNNASNIAFCCQSAYRIYEGDGWNIGKLFAFTQTNVAIKLRKSYQNELLWVAFLSLSSIAWPTYFTPCSFCLFFF